ncbi:hypothetical protein M569_13459 [Genlisea aurea]|uniref:Secreted protein n=1 Tax=Genlisea aurea TaxID=192259 RepID=S8CAH0_9LAMI|nr:hypothetical protein M569_13459 [Genlisea aurea]
MFNRAISRIMPLLEIFLLLDLKILAFSVPLNDRYLNVSHPLMVHFQVTRDGILYRKIPKFLRLFQRTNM